MKVEISKDELDLLVEKGIITENQVPLIWEHLLSEKQIERKFNGINVIYYMGALLIISAMTWFATEAFSKYNAIGLMLVALVYFVGLLLTGSKLFKIPMYHIPGGLLLTCAVFMVPLFIFSVQQYFSLWLFQAPGMYNEFYLWVRGGWFFMELGTIVVSLIFLHYYKFPFLTFACASSLWFLSMDVAPIIFSIKGLTWEGRQIISLYFGLLMLIIAYFVDKKCKVDFAFWMYFFGLICFWGGLTFFMDTKSEFFKFIYCVINTLLVVISVLFRRKTFIIFGGLGIYNYLFHLSMIFFRGSLIFPVILSLFGALIIWLGMVYHKNSELINSYVLGILPPNIYKLLPPERD